MQSNAGESLDDLMRRLAEGDRSVFARVFDGLWTPVNRLCRGLLRNEADAADASQEAMLKILERATQYDATRPAIPWALAIAAWECRTLSKKRARRREVSDELSPEQAGEDPEALLQTQDLVAAAVAAMGELSETDRETLLAGFLESEASSSGATLRKRRQRALQRLKVAFRRLYGIR